ncbi:MAG: AAA family ATPase [Minisyncoccia bacterium]
MKLSSFHVKNYQSVLDSGQIDLSVNDNVTIFAGQNESGKSSLLRALYDYEQKSFSADSLPFEEEDITKQSVSVTYSVTDKESFFETLNGIFIEEYDIKVEPKTEVLDRTKIQSIESFTITIANGEKKAVRSIQDDLFEKIKSSVLDVPTVTEASAVETATETTEQESAKAVQKYILIPDTDNSKMADILFRTTPSVVFFDDFCDLLPDSILVSDLVNKSLKAKGYRAVKNFEKIIGADFTTKEAQKDAVRRTKEDEENSSLSVDFQKDWGQRIHDENEVIVKYNYEKRNGETGSYINFYVETKAGQPLSPRQRSKGLIWFLSLWLELNSQSRKHSHLVLLLDEPDQHLHVKAQKDVLLLMNKLASEGSQVICATHSPYLLEVEFLNRIRLIINQKKEGTVVESITTSKLNTKNRADALQPIADAIGLHASEFSKLNKKNVLLEGVSDFNYFLAMKAILKDDEDYNFIPGIGVRKINSLISLCLGYGLKWVCVIDDDGTLGGKDSISKFEEIKTYVFDGDEDKTKEKVHILSGIVGIENMFTLDDLKLTGLQITSQSTDNVVAVGQKRKVLCSQLFKEIVDSGEIKASQISPEAKANFKAAFKFIKDNLK